MKKFFALLKVSVKSMLLSSTNARGNSRKKAATGVGAMVLIAFLGLYIGSTEKVEIGEYMQGNYNIYAKKPCRIRKCAPIRYFNDADHSLVMQYIHAGSTCVAPQNRHFCV